MLRWVWILGVVLILAGGVSSTAAEARAPKGTGGVWLGVLIDEEQPADGLQLVAVVPGGPAERAGLQPGDVLLRADGRGLARIGDLKRVLARLEPGDSVSLAFLRAGQSLERVVALAPQTEVEWELPPAAPDRRPAAPSPAPPPPEAPPTVTTAYGLTLVDVTPDLRVHYGAPAESGVLVTGVRSGRPADRAGVRVGDVLVELGRVRVHRAGDVDQALLTWGERDDDVLVELVRNNERKVVRLESPRLPPPHSRPVEMRTVRTESLAAAELLERSIEAEIGHLRQRIAQLEQRLELLRVRRERDADD